MTTERIKLAAIRTDGGTQMRAAIDPAVVEDYADAYRAAAPMPPVTVFYDGKDYWLGNGFHRVEAQRACTFIDTDAEVRPGTRRDAVLHAAGANAANGLRPTNADKRRAVEVLLRDAEWSRWSDRKIAEACGVGHPLVATVRRDLTGRSSSEDRRFVTKHGTEAVMNTAAIGKTPKRTPLAAVPSTPLATAMSGVAPVVRLMPSTNLFVPSAEQAVPTPAPTDWNPETFLSEVRSQIEEWRGAWLVHEPALTRFVTELRLNVSLLEKEDARKRTSHG